MNRYTIEKYPNPDFMTKEALNRLCANISFSDTDMKTVMITSCRPQEGKSFISMSLMRSFAEMRQNVLLLDLDIRASVLQKKYKISCSDRESRIMGVSDFLMGKCKLDDIVAKTDIPYAYMILAGKTISDPLPYLKSQSLVKAVGLLKEKFDLVIIDAPPIGSVIDAAVIAEHCDGTLLVVQNNLIRQSELNKAIQQIDRTGCRVLGTVLNKVEYSKYEKYKGYDSYYNTDKKNNR